ncbi:MAG: SDR family oxidoreductase [Saprospiraceae bacterium]|nr:SDR family oxidoreductase [Saprospiraceae bacterium]
MKEFSNKSAIVTGATSGMGQNITEALSDLNVRVILSGRDQKRGSALEAKLQGNGHFVPGDVKDPALNKLLVDSARNQTGRLDYVVLAAGELGIGSITEVSIDDWEDTIATNLNAVFYLLKYAIPLMLEGEGGSIVIVGSVASHHAFPNHPAYTASKGALPALVRQIARDYGPRIRINLVSPAQVMTPLLHNSVKAFPNPDQILEETAEKLPMQRIGIPGDITNTVIHLLSDGASWITGSDFVVDGGFLAT